MKMIPLSSYCQCCIYEAAYEASYDLRMMMYEHDTAGYQLDTDRTRARHTAHADTAASQPAAPHDTAGAASGSAMQQSA